MRVALRQRYSLPEFAMLEEVGDGTGGHKSRSADAIAMCCYPSRGLELTGFEIKVSRSDWLRELADPSKAEAVCRYCDRWYIVAGSPDLVKAEELPATWGLLAPKAGKLAIIRQAPKLQPIEWPRHFIASILRTAAEGGTSERTIREAEGRAAANATARCEEIVRNRYEGEIAGLKFNYEKLQSEVAAFTKASGIPIQSHYSPGSKVGEAVSFVMRGGLRHAGQEMASLEQAAKSVLRSIDSYRQLMATSGFESWESGAGI
ncbi:hypothetical protein [Singulisphaera sp. PoT]|uniref:hypothetical protein n=1 Tax=Singulisphaera sp. PoT TaxID=3411797 RepID=UPI003BF4ABC4